MIRTLATALAAGMLLSSSYALAADEPATAAPNAPPPPSAMSRPHSNTDRSEVICKREQSTESRLGGAKICHTRGEWADMAAAARDSVDSMQRNANYTSPH